MNDSKDDGLAAVNRVNSLAGCIMLAAVSWVFVVFTVGATVAGYYAIRIVFLASRGAYEAAAANPAAIDLSGWTYGVFLVASAILVVWFARYLYRRWTHVDINWGDDEDGQ